MKHVPCSYVRDGFYLFFFLEVSYDRASTQYNPNPLGNCFDNFQEPLMHVRTVCGNAARLFSTSILRADVIIYITKIKSSFFSVWR